MDTIAVAGRNAGGVEYIVVVCLSHATALSFKLRCYFLGKTRCRSLVVGLLWR